MRKSGNKNIEDILALTPLQEGLLFHYLKDPDNGDYLEQFSLEISGDFRQTPFEKAWNFVVRTNPMLRTIFRWEKLAHPVQMVLKDYVLQPVYHDLTGLAGKTKKKRLLEITAADKSQAINIREHCFKVTLCKVEETRYVMTVTNHHILYDGWSNGIILKEFFQAYHTLCNNNQLSPPPLKTPFKEFIQWYRYQDESKQKLFWKDYLKEFNSHTTLPLEKKQANEEEGPANPTALLKETVKDKINLLTRKDKITPASIFYAAWGVLLQRYCNSRDVIFGTTVSGRSAAINGIEDMVGLFINTIPLRVNTRSNETITAVLHQINQSLTIREQYEATPLVAIKEYSPLGNEQELFNSIVVLENYPLEKALHQHKEKGNSRFSIDSYSMVEKTHYDLTVGITLLDEFQVDFNFNRQLSDAESVERLVSHFMNILEEIVTDPGKLVTAIEMLSPLELDKLLVQFNDTKADYPPGKTIHGLFEEQVERVPDNIAVIGPHSEALTYHELNRKTNQLAGVLRAEGTQADSIVAIMMERSLGMVIGIFAVLKAGGAYLPITPGLPRERIDYMLKDSAAKVILTNVTNATNDLKVIDPSDAGQFPNHSTSGPPDSIIKLVRDENIIKPVRDGLAYVIYTSGSTGKPKGVLVEHFPMVSRLHWFKETYCCDQKDVSIQLAVFTFDVSVDEIFRCIPGAGKLYLPPIGVEKDPEQLIRCIHRHQVTLADLVPSMFTLLLDYLDEEISGTPLPLKYIITGAEIVHPQLVKRFQIIFRGNGKTELINGYGPTEAVVDVSRFDCTNAGHLGVIPIGKPIANTRLTIEDRYRHLQPVGIAGELCIQGHCLARGYLNQPGLTARQFVESTIAPGERMYRSGDLARWMPDGNIEFLGRVDRQVKVRGFRVEPGEIENHLLKHEDLKEIAVLDLKDRGGKTFLAAWFVPAPGIEDPGPVFISGLKHYLSTVVPDYMVPSYFIPLDELPLNPNGKVNRGALPEPGLSPADAETYVAPRDAVEEKLVDIWSEVLAIEQQRIGIDHNFFQLGGHSLKAILMMSRIHQRLGIKITLTEIFETPTIRGLSAVLKCPGTSETAHVTIPLVEEKEYYPLSPAQKRLYVLHRMDPDSTNYNMSWTVMMEGPVDREQLAGTFTQLIRRHESLRTSFALIDGEPAQKIHHPDDGTHIEIESSGIGDFIRPFDLSHPPLLRVSLIPLAEHKHILAVDMHHIISDGVSIAILTDDFMAFYKDAGSDLPPLSLRYKDYALWQNSRSRSPAIKEQGEWWLKQMAGDIPVLEIPVDFIRPAIKSPEGRQLDFDLEPGISTQLRTLAHETGTTPFMLLLAIFNLLLSKLSGQEDIIVGTPTVGRPHSDLQPIIGIFVNTLGLRNFPVPDKQFVDFLDQVKENCLQAFDHQDYQFENLVETIVTQRDLSRNALFDVAFTLQNITDRQLELPGLTLSPYPYETKTSKFDLTLTAIEDTDVFLFSLEYGTTLFKQETIERFSSYFKRLTDTLTQDRRQRLYQVELLSAAERRQILEDFNNTSADYPTHKTIHQLFEEQVEQVPDYIALTQFNAFTSYRELNNSADRLACYLREKGVGPGGIVGLMLERSFEMIIGIYAILKAGGSYLPIDPTYPPGRIHFMLKDSSAKIIITNVTNITNELKVNGLDDLMVIKPGDADEFPHRKTGKPPVDIIKPVRDGRDGLAYVIYTSGSTGNPKGVMIEHPSVVNRLKWMQSAYPIDKGDVVLQKTPIVFDVSVWELFWWSWEGARLCLLGPGDEKDPEEILKTISIHRVTTMHFVPPMLNAFLGHLDGYSSTIQIMQRTNRLKSLRQVFASGEALQVNQVEHFNRLCHYDSPDRPRLINLYGPTEATVDVSWYNCPLEGTIDKVPIGKPIDNIALYVFNTYFQLQPIGVVGELCIAGIGLARGYLNRPGLTAEKFILAHSSLLIAHRKNKDSTQEAASNIPAMSYEPSAMSFLYKTGDLARWLPDGNIEFLGRQDHQVKIRGYRIELGEISSKLSTHEAVKDAVTMAISPDQHLTAYVVPDPETAYPICQWLELERQGIPADREYYQWPNGMTPFYLNRQETDFMYKEIFEELSYLKHGITIEDGACVIDVGANIGVFSLFIHQACRNARIYAFEPIPPVNELLSLNTRIYGVDARVFQCGVGSETGEVEFTFYPHVSILSGRFADIEDEQETVKNYMFNQEFPAENPDNLSEAQLSEMLADRLSSITFTCPIKTLSQVIRENEIDTIDLLKIDVEKSEADVLKGIDEPDWGRIRQLVVEVHDSHGRLEEITQLLKGHGYDVIAEQEEELGSTKLVNLYAKLPEARNHRSIREPSGNHSRYLGIQQFISDMKHFLTDKLPEYMVPQSFVLLEQLPLQANGKVNRKALPKPDISHSITGEYVPPADKTEEQLVEIWSEVLALDPACIGVNHNFFQLGGHSLKAVTHANRVYKTFDVQMPLTEIFRTPTIRELCATFKSLSPSKIPPAVIPLVEEKEYYPLSPAQKRLYVLNQMEMNSTNYNISWAAILEGPVVDREQLAGTFAQLIRRHESLRTSFTLIDGQPVQKIRRIQGGTHIEFESSKLDDFIRPFDLAHPPLLRVGLAPLAENKHMLAVDMHHIISDGVSMSILVEEFMAFYDDKGSRLPPLSLRYKDYALWQNSRAHSPEIKEQEEWWLSQMTGDIPVLELPADFPRPAVKSAKGRRLDFHLEPGISTRLKTLTHETGTTPFMVLLAIFNLLLSKLSGQEDIIVGTPTAGRSHSDLQPIIGVFINTLGLRNSIAPEKQFVQFLDQVKENCLQAFLYQDYQFEDLVETVVTERDLSRNALFDVMFTLQNMDRRDLEIPGLSLSPYQYDTLTSQFDLTLTAIEDTDRFLFSLDYGSTLFKQETIRRFISYFKRLTDTLTKDSRQRLSQVELLSIAEKRRILEEFNNTSADYPAHQTIQQLFEEQVERTPDHIAVVGPDKELPVSISYRELNDRSDHLARRLQEKGVKTGTIAGIMVPRSLAVFTGILAILKAGAAYLPIDPRYPEARISYMLKDSRSVLLLTQKELEKQLEDISLSGSNNKNPAKNNQVIAGPDDIAYVIYTSGSTGQPKGVMIEHSSVLNVLSALYRAYPFEASDVYLLKTTLVFDVSVSELFGWFWGGGRLAILEPGGEQDPSAITAAIRRFGVTHINFVPSMFSLFVNLLKSESIDQSAALKYIFLAGEALLPGLVEKSSYLNEKVAIENIYGPTEATVYASRYSLSQRTGKTNIPIGKPLQNTRLYILDGGGRLQPIGIPGELCIAGAGVARGYLNRPELTAEKFDRDLIKELSAASAVIYRTGDSARWLADGNIEFLGRIDHQVKVRGFRIEPGEIENHLLKHEKVMEAVVPALKDKNGDTFLAAYFVPAPGIENSVFIPRLKEYLLTVVPDYMVPSYFISIDELPLTPSGKIDRGALPKPGLSPGDAEAYAAPRDDVEEKLADIWSDVLSPEQQRISIHHNFFQMGGHSLNAILLTSRIHQTFNVKLPLTQVFKHPTIAGISRSIREAHREDHISIPPCEARQYYPLSPAQKRLYVLHQMEMNSTNYNISWAVMLEGHIDRERLTGIFPDLIRRHESLRTSFHLLHGEPLQKIHNDGDFEIESLETDVFVRPFDLSRVPLLRVNLLLLSEGKHELAVDMHHIISDGVSMALLVREFMALYNGDELPPLSLSYKDYALWQISRVQSPAVKTQKQWWLNQMEGEIPVLELPIDFPRPAVKTPEGSRLDFEIGPDLSMQLNQLADRTGTTPFMVLLSLFNLLLSKLSGQEDIIVGTPTAGRPHNDLQDIIGVFINTLALRNFPSGEKRFSRFLSEVKENALQAFENQDYQFEDLVDTLVGKRDLSRNSIFDVMFVFQNTGSRRLEIPGLELTPYDYQSDTSKFDLTLTAMESGDRFVFSITYSTKLFKQDTIRQLVNYFKRLTTRLPVDDSLQMAGISLLSDEEKLRLLTDFNGTQTNYPTTVTIHREFETQVQKTPHHIAVVHNEQSLTYHQLNERSNQSARLLRRSGLRADTIAGLLVDPSLEMLIGILSVLKAGGAYLPIDPLQPAERVRFMLNDSRAVLLLTTLKRKQSADTIDFDGPVFTIDDTSLYNEKTGNLPPVTTPEHVVYTIYTSGTSGQSKGALVQNGNLVNYVYWLRREARLTSEDRALLTSSFGFDLGYSSLYPSILSGCPLNIIPRETWLSAEDLTGYIIKNRISYIKVTPSLFSTIVESPGFSVRACPSLRLVILGGEAIKLKDLEKAHAVRPGTAFINHYGPTEATIGCVAQPINFNHFDDYLNRPVIGRPIHNMKAIILDKGKQPVPPGVPGELCVSGAGVIRGYLNRPELTAEKFIPHPYLPGEGMYFTGDLARWLSQGTVEFLGRIDSQVKIRGYRVELAEIENRLLTHQEVEEAAVIQRENPSGDNYLCAYVVPLAPHFDTGRLREHLAASLPDYMIPSSFVTIDVIPLTANGKLNRGLLPEPETHTPDTEYAAPRDKMEETLVKLRQEVLGLSSQYPPPGIDDDFFRLGGHSLNAIILVSKIHKHLDIAVSLTDIFRFPTVRNLARRLNDIKSPGSRQYTAIEPVEEKEYYPLSPAQKRLYALHLMEPDSTNYNIPRVVILEGPVDRERLARTFGRLIHRHESLRTSFALVNGESIQQIHGKPHLEIESSRPEDFIRPFDLSHPPLLRVSLVPLAENKHLLATDMHHIVSDGVSTPILLGDFMALYEHKDSPLSPLNLRYKDYAQWQNSRAHSSVITEQKEWWLKQMSGDIPVLELPVDFPRPAIKSPAGGQLDFHLEPRISARLRALTHDETGTTLFMVLLAIFNLLLSKLSGQEDIIVGTPTAGRPHNDLQDIIGVFINTLPLRNFPSGDKSFSGFLSEVKENALQAFLYQDYQFEDLVETVVTQRDLSRNALFDVMLNLQNMDGRVLAIPGLTLSPYQYETVTSKFDLILTVILENTGDFFFSLNYSTTLFKQETIERFIDYFKRLTGRLTENKQQRLSQVELLSDEERRRILEDFNNTQVDYPSDQTIHQLFEEQVLQTGDCPALIGSKQITYRELDKKSNQLAGRLNREGIAVGTIIAIIATRSVEMLVGILAILKAGGAYLPINPDYPPGRIQYMLEDTNTPLMLTHSLSAGNDLSAAVGIPFIPLAHPSSYTGSSDSPGHPDTPSAPAYVMYTSGSTGKPKGVLVEHRNVNRLVINTDYVRFTPETRILQTGAPVFDATTFEMWGALLNGGQLALVEQETILDAHRLGRAIQEFRVNTLWLSSALFNQLFHDNPDMFLPLNYLLVGGDVLSPPHINALRKKCKSLKIINGYGPTENTTFSTTFLINRDYRDSIPIGSPISNSTAYILNNSACLQPVGIVGELCVGGDGVAVGYLNNPEATAEKFIRYAPLKGKRLYRTGDFVRWMPDGNIAFQGRVDNQIKIRGFRVETAEIESELLQHGHIREAVIIPKEHEDGSKYLCAYIVAGDEIPVSQLRDYLQDRLPGYMIPTYIMQLEQMPLTPNGKIDRKALPDPERQEAHRYIAPGNEMEEKMAEIWSEILGLSSDRIGINDDFFQSGGHSLKAVGLLARVHKDFSVQIPIPDLFSNPTISGICRLIAKSGASVYHAVQPVEEREYYPLSSAQKRLFVLQQMDKESVGYNLPMIWQVAGNIDGGKIEEVFQRLVQRHESLRTSFYLVKENAVQRVHPEKKFEMNDVNPEGPMEDFIRPFDLSNAPLLRVGLMKKGDRSHLMLMDMHHIISDGASMQVFINDFTTLYAGKHLPLPRLQYKDFSQWQNSPGQEEAIKKQEVYWLKQFGGDLPILNLPTDYPRPASHRFEGETSRIKLGEAESVAIIQLTRQWGASLYMVLLAVYTVFLSRISGREDVIVGTPMAGRSREELQGIIGMFVNTHGIRNIAESGKTFDHFIEDVKENTLEALENQDYPFDQLVNKVLVNRETGHNPLFDVLFTFRDKENTTLDIPGLTLKPYPYDRGVTKFDLTLSAEECPDGLKLTFEYSTRLFKAETLERFSAYFIEIICSVLENPHRQLGTIEMKPQSEKQALLDAIQQSDKGYPPAKTITELFEDQVKRTPDHIALVGHFADEKVDEHNLGYHLRHLTYSQLNQAGGHLARQLVEKGVQPNNIVGIQLERCIQMMIGILGILKSGATYLPMNPKQPPQRTRFMMADTGAVMLLTGAEILRLSAGAAPGGSEYGHISTTVQSVAYIIYTSGSTGNPKGVPITHANFSPLLHWTYHEYGIDTRHRALKNLSFFFDWCVWEIFVILTTGASLYTIDADLLSNAGLMLELMRRYDITWLNITPTQYRYLLDEEQSQETLRVLNLGAEKLSLELTGAALGRVAENCRVFNLYGPTETTILTAFMEITPGNFDNFTDLSSVPIGWPTGNTVLLVLDQHFRPCPIGVQGELYIAGDALANGYLNNKELTGEKFILIPTPRWGLGLNTELRCYKTGDLVRRLPDGVIEYIGRTDHQVKIRGFRIEPGEIKISLEKNKVVKEALVMARENQRNERYLCAYIIPAADHTGTPDIVAELKDYLSSQLPAYMVPAVFLTLDKMPLNPNRKVDLKALPEPRFNEKDTHHISPRNGIERQIARIWADTLQLEEDNIGIDSDFFYLGGHSMSATVAIGKIHHECGVRIPLARFFVMTTIRKLAKHIQSSGDRVFQSIPELEKAQYYEISSGQKRLYLLQQPDPASIDYNMTNAFVFDGDLDRERFETTCRDLIRRHEGLRTFFRQADGRIVQCILEHAPFQVKYSNARHESQINDHIKRFIAPFDLSRAPLFRVEVIALNEKKHVVMFDMHHIVSDGNSMDLLSHDFFHLYVGGNTGLVPLTVQYKDYAHWRNNTLSGENLKKQDDYWMEKLRGFSFTQLPIDNIGGYQQVLGKKEVLNIEAPLYDKIKTFCNEMNVTGFAFMLTAFNIALFAETEQSDLTIGIPVSQRNHPDLKNLVGMFLNVLLIRSVIDNENTFDDFLMQNKQTAIDALNHQHYPYEILSTRMTEHSPSRSKDLFSILFNYINTPTDNTLTAGDFSIQPYENSEAAPKYDITLYVYDTGNAITLSAVYKGNLYEESTVRNLLEALYLVINDVFVSGNVEISALIADMYSYRYQGEEGFDNEFEQYYDEYED